MIKVIEKNTLFNTCKRYELLQGDSFRFSATEIHVPQENLIQKITFKIADKENCIFFQKEYVKHENNRWLLFVESSESANFKVGTHKSEIEVTYLDGGVDTIEKVDFVVLAESKECVK